MLTRVNFISTDTLKANSSIDEDVSDKILKNAIRRAEDLYIYPTLGEKLYNKIYNDLSANTISGAYSTLLYSYILPALIEYSHLEAIEDLYAKETNTGIILKANVENAVSVEREDLVRKEDKIKKAAQFYLEKLESYLCANSNLFSEYGTETAGELAPSDDNVDDFSLYIPDKFDDINRIIGYRAEINLY